MTPAVGLRDSVARPSMTLSSHKASRTYGSGAGHGWTLTNYMTNQWVRSNSGWHGFT